MQSPATFASVLPSTAVAFLRALGPEPWGVVAGGRLRLFGEKQLGPMVKWIEHAASQQVGVYAMQPMREGMVRHLAVRAPREFRPAHMRLAPSLVVTAEQSWMLWALNDPISIAEARRLSADLARQCGGVVAVGEGVPLPGTPRQAETGVGLAVQHQVRMLPPLARAYRLDGGELAAVVKKSAAVVDDGFERADQFSAPALEFLWPGVLPAGEFALIAGPPKIGKSSVVADLAARLTTGAAWPDGAPGGSPGGAILIEGEDPLGVTQGRLRNAGANMARVMLSATPLDLSQPAGVAAIERQRVRLGGARLLSLSPVRLFFGADEAMRQIDLRNRLAPLLSWASAHGVTVLGVAHRESGQDGRSSEHVAGPRAYAQRARAVLSVMVDPSDRTAKSNPNAARRLLTSAGSNLTADTFELRYRIEGVPGGGSRIAWGA